MQSIVVARCIFEIKRKSKDLSEEGITQDAGNRPYNMHGILVPLEHGQ